MINEDKLEGHSVEGTLPPRPTVAFTYY